MSQAGEETTQNINLNVSGAEKVAGATALLTDLSGALQQLLTNPLGGTYAMNRIAHGLETAFVDPMKKSVNLTKVQQLEFDKLVSKSRAILTTIGFVSGLALSMTELIRKTKLASSEMGKFMSFDQLPGGAGDFYDAQLTLQRDFIEKSLKYNDVYGQDYERMLKGLRRKLIADITPPGASKEHKELIRETAAPQIEALIEQLTTLQTGTGVSVTGFTDLRDELKAVGLDITDIIDLYKTLMAEVTMFDTFGGMDQMEVATMFKRSILQYKESGTLAPAALGQILTVMETYADYAGEGEIQKLIEAVPRFQNELESNIFAQKFLGITTKDLRGPEAGFNVIDALTEKVQGLVKQREEEGVKTTPENIMDIWRQSPGGTEIVKKMGVSPGLMQLLMNLEDVDVASSSVLDKFNEMSKQDVGLGLLKSSQTIDDAMSKINEGLEGSSDIFETIKNIGGWLGINLQEGLKAAGLDVDARVLQGIIGTATVGAGVMYGPRMLRAGLRFAGKLLGAGMTEMPGVVGAGAKFTPWGTEAAVTTTRGTGLMGKGLRMAGKFGKGLGIAGAVIGEGIEAYQDVQEYQEKDIGFGEGLARSTIKAMYKYNPVTMAANITMGWKKIFEGENVFDAIFNTDVTKEMGNVIFGEGTQKPPKELADLMVPSHLVAGKQVGTQVGVGDKDLPNLNIIIRTAEGDILANTTLQEAVHQGAISIVMEGIVGVTK